jgi:uncharacterized LabA/DUF88 family protein
MTDGSGLLDRPMSSGGGGSSGRRRGGRRVDSMIAGRRKPSDEGSDGDDNGASDEKPRSRSTRSSNSSSRSRTSSTSGTSTADRKPAARKSAAKKPATRKPASRSRASKSEDGEAAEQKPTRRRRTSAAVKAAASKPEAETPEAAVEVVEEPVEEPVAEVAAVAAPARPARRTSAAAGGDMPAAAVQAELEQLRALVEQQRTMLTELHAGLTAVAEATDRAGYRPRLGIFVDVPNVMYGVDAGSAPVHMGKLLDFLSAGRELVRATAYSPVSDDPREPMEQQKFVAPFVPYNYRITTKPLKRFADGSIKGNFDVEMALDMLQMADRLDILTIVSGDADFSRAVEAVQTRGVRVEVVAFAGSASIEMRALADRYIQLDSVLREIT